VFTDIVGSSEIFYIYGDEFGHEIIQIHDKIVRENLQRFSGTEIKHTGDGILATFDSCGRSIKASLHIARSILKHSDDFPLLKFSVRIGVNVGNVKVTTADVYGGSVNLAAKLCALAGDDSVLCTGIVRSRCEPKGYRFTDGGFAEVKGFPVKIPIHHALP
jgi:class 3 adenylate cyclase